MILVPTQVMDINISKATTKQIAVKKIPIRATILSALSVIPYVLVLLCIFTIEMVTKKIHFCLQFYFNLCTPNLVTHIKSKTPITRSVHCKFNCITQRSAFLNVISRELDFFHKNLGKVASRAFRNILFLVPTQSWHLGLGSSRLILGRETFRNSRVLPKR